MKRILVFAALALLCSVVAITAEATDNKKVQKTECQSRESFQERSAGLVKALRIDADHGDVSAMNTLAIMYAQGHGVARNTCVAMKLFQQSAAEGYAPAMINLGTMYAIGENLRHDEARAYAWIRAALIVGVADEDHDATVFKLGAIAGRLDTVQFERAELLATKIAHAVALRRAPPAEKDSELSEVEKGT
jgi:TPR repeat protein